MLLGWVRLRWPISEAALAASRRTAVPPSRPAIQASDSASRLSSCSRATLTCSIRLPRRDQLVKGPGVRRPAHRLARSEEHTSELQSLITISYAVFCLKKKKNTTHIQNNKLKKKKKKK